MDKEEHEFKFRVDAEADLDALVAEVTDSSSPVPPPSRQTNHFYDTRDWRLRDARCALRLREEAGRFLLTAKGKGIREDAGPLAVRAEEEILVEPEEARAILAGECSPLLLLIERIGEPAPALLSTMLASVEDRVLLEVGAFRNDRRRLGPIALPVAGGELEVLFELDRTEFPGGRIHHEIEVEVEAGDAELARTALLDLLARAGVTWRPSTSKAKRFFDILTRRES